ncbi:MAG: DUF4162 domain-containing protein, partial [Thaumarchaeota archaeon]|nr:DUF4162 domain-containing protein [Nitrososphaerota archaeon]
IIALGTPSELKSKLSGDIVRLKTGNNADISPLKNLRFIHKIELVNGYVILNVDDAKRNIPEILKLVEVEYVEYSSPTLNDVFIKLTGRTIREQAEGGFMERYVQYDRN